jgi:hypothetical protein
MLFAIIFCINQVIGITIIPFLLILLINSKKTEKYDYDSENPNALISGKNISGTVYASYPDNTPGLGWIL